MGNPVAAAPLHVRPAFLAGLIGAGIQASRTPAMHEKEGAEQGLRYIYKLIDLQALKLGAEALPELLLAAERMGFNGLNITFPCKQAAIPLLHELSDDARALGAVNTVVLRDGKRIGHNTDASGFEEGFRRGLPDVKRERVVQVGAGGAGSAVAHAVMKLGAGHLTLFDTDRGKAEQVAHDLCARFGAGRAEAGGDLAAALTEADGLVNATPVGMAKIPGTPVPKALLRRRLVGRRDHLLPARDRAAQGRPRARLSNAGRRRDGSVSGGRGFPPDHRHHPRRRADARALRLDGHELTTLSTSKGERTMKNWLTGVLMAALVGMASAAALAADYPTRQLQGIIQWGAGGSTDGVSRDVTPLVEPHLGQKIVLVNKPGGTGVIATQYVSSRPADGYTLLYGAENPQLYGVLGLSKLSYRDFFPVDLLARGVVVIVANKDTPWNSFKELVDDVKQRPGEVKMGSTGTGGVPYVVRAMMETVIDGFKVTAVPFEGDGPGLTALQGGHVDFMPAVLGAARELITSGRVKPLAVVNSEPLPGLDGVKPVTEDYPGFAKYLPWGPFFGVFVRKDTPEEVKTKLVEAFHAGAAEDKFKQFTDNVGLIRMNVSGDEATKFLDRWQSVTAWLLQDTGAAKTSPEELGIPRPE